MVGGAPKRKLDLQTCVLEKRRSTNSAQHTSCHCTPPLPHNAPATCPPHHCRTFVLHSWKVPDQASWKGSCGHIQSTTLWIIHRSYTYHCYLSAISTSISCFYELPIHSSINFDRVVDHIATCSSNKRSVVEQLGGTQLCNGQEWHNNAYFSGITAQVVAVGTNPVVHFFEQHRKAVTIFNRC